MCLIFDFTHFEARFRRVGDLTFMQHTYFNYFTGQSLWQIKSLFVPHIFSFTHTEHSIGHFSKSLQYQQEIAFSLLRYYILYRIIFIKQHIRGLRHVTPKHHFSPSLLRYHMSNDIHDTPSILPLFNFTIFHFIFTLFSTSFDINIYFNSFCLFLSHMELQNLSFLTTTSSLLLLQWLHRIRKAWRISRPTLFISLHMHNTIF